MDDVRVYSATLVVDLILPHSRSIKDRRQPLRGLLQRLRNHDFAIAQVGPADLTQRVFLAVCAVSGSEHLLQERVALAERLFYDSGFEVADVQRRLTSYSAPSLA